MSSWLGSAAACDAAGLVAALGVVAGAVLVRPTDDRPPHEVMRRLTASLGPLCLGLFGAMFLPVQRPGGSSPASIVLQAEAPALLRVSFGVLTLLPLAGAAAFASMALRARPPGRIAAAALQLLAGLLLATLALETRFLVDDVWLHPAHLVSLAGPALSLTVGVASFRREGWERAGLAGAASLFATAPYVGQLIANDARGGFPFEGPGAAVLVLSGLLSYGQGVGLALALTPLALRPTQRRSPGRARLHLLAASGALVALVLAAGSRVAGPGRPPLGERELPEPHEPTFPGELYPPTTWLDGPLAETAEPWPSTGPWSEPTGEGAFSLVLHGVEPALFQVGKALLLGSYPRLLRVEGGELVELPRPPRGEGGTREYQDVWEVSGRLALWEDQRRHYTNPSPTAAFFTLADGAWRPAPELRETRGSGSERVVPFAAGREVIVGEDGARWRDGRGLLELGAPDPGCIAWWKVWFSAVVAGDDTYVATRQCKGGPSVFRITKDGAVTALPALPVYDLWVRGLHPLERDGEHGGPEGDGRRVLVVGTCTHEPRDPLGHNCVLLWDGRSWVDQGRHLDGMDLATSRLVRDGTLWVLLAHDGNGSSGLLRPRGPVPSGELHRRTPEGRWEKMVFPTWPLPNWNCLRFAPISLGLAGDVPWVSGKWYYVRKPRFRRVETLVYGGLFRLGPSRGPPTSLYPGPPTGP